MPLDGWPPGASSQGKRFYAVARGPPRIGVYAGWERLRQEAERTGASLSGRPGDFKGFAGLEPAFNWLVSRAGGLCEIPLCR